MRVPVTSSGRPPATSAARPRSSSRILAVFLVGLSAFTVDLGAAYVSNRNLQKAADAGALAGGAGADEGPRHVQRRRCRNSARGGKAHAARDRRRQEELPRRQLGRGRQRRRVDLRPPAQGRSLVEFGNSGTTDARFAGVFGGAEHDHHEPHRRGHRRRRPRQRARACGRSPSAPLPIGDTAARPLRPDLLPRQRHEVPAAVPQARRHRQLVDPRLPRGPRRIDRGRSRPRSRTAARAGVTVIPGQADANTPGALTVILEAACPRRPPAPRPA